jgi:hypothetical protein
MVLSEGIYAMLITGGFGFLAGVLAILYKSKCTRIECCCFKIDRDVQGEEKLDQEELELRAHRNDTTPSAV